METARRLSFRMCFTDPEPKDLQVEHIYRLLDLAATEEDHGEVCASHAVLA